ncbi:hypothetical protein DUNSADRAFT_13065 [Dunaliella salina]|uniref:Uncharacterized protein n=1 Tax=Dunaliella salina TaxID=3046 RepID=A0ABQ7H3F5_DUNSA|nr:hypothetical protein DUNSADRAFT_13065 [Dunaliella salina]|eukprot:KAF5841402.1 hypothetical protein DUNSADRAFT_13065 [Dunaliella salina]
MDTAQKKAMYMQHPISQAQIASLKVGYRTVP